MKRQTIIISIILAIATGNPGCKKFIEIDPPETQLITETVFETDETANSAMAGLYANMMEKQMVSYLTALYSGLYGDELKSYTTNVGNTQAYTNSLNAKDSGTNNIWDAVYNLIYQANAIIEGCKNSTTLSTPVKKQLTAESQFIRAYWHFYLMNFYGDIPLITSTDYRANGTAIRSSIAEVYAQVIADLESAKIAINENYIGPDSKSTSMERIRPNKSAVCALLSRVYLFKGENKLAEENATTVINNKTLYDTVPLKQVFLKNSKEAIFQLMKPTPTNSTNTYEGSNFILTGKPSATSFNRSSTISPTLFSLFEVTDKRKAQWLNKFTDKAVNPNVDYYFPFKYQVRTSAEVTEYLMVFRVGELLLIRSEARANLDNQPGAIADLDVIRKRAGLPLIKDTDPGISKANLLSAISKERQLELFTEWGLHWLDLKRFGKVDEVMSIIAPTKGGVWNTTKQLWPIPQQSLDANTKLKQNPGYN